MLDREVKVGEVLEASRTTDEMRVLVFCGDRGGLRRHLTAC
jgi:hypothetical protein